MSARHSSSLIGNYLVQLLCRVRLDAQRLDQAIEHDGHPVSYGLASRTTIWRWPKSRSLTRSLMLAISRKPLP
jgi:hypothetical protein